MHHVIGPMNEHYVAATAFRTAAGVWVRAKITRQPCTELWDGVPACGWLCLGPFELEVTAVAIALDRAADLALRQPARQGI